MDDKQSLKKPSIIEMAKKKRHIHLLEKIQKGKALSLAELKELAKFEGGQLAPGIVENHPQIAKVFKVTVRTIRNWVAEGMPVLEDGRYDLMRIQEWRNARSGVSENSSQKDALSAQLQKIKIKREEMRFQKEMGELIAKSEVEGVLVQLISAFKRSFMSLGRALAPQLSGREPREIDAVITARIRQIIQDFSEGKRLFKK